MKWAWGSATIFDLQNWRRFILEEVLYHLSFYSDFVANFHKKKIIVSLSIISYLLLNLFVLPVNIFITISLKDNFLTAKISCSYIFY